MVKHQAVPIQSQFVAHMIRKVLPQNGICVVDAGNGGKHVRSYFKKFGVMTILVALVQLMCIFDVYVQSLAQSMKQ